MQTEYMYIYGPSLLKHEFVFSPHQRLAPDADSRSEGVAKRVGGA